MRFHGFKFQTKPNADGSTPNVNPYAPDQFTRPVRLHRRYAREKQEPADQSDAPSGVDDREREIYNARRAERQAEREANQALIAPTGNAAKKPQAKKKNQKNVEDVYYDENDPKQQKAAQLRYEETRPWHLDDFDNKNVWVGAYQDALSENGVLFKLDEGGFAMIPVERWYIFRQTNKVATMDPEQVEKHMAKKFKAPRWFLKTQEANDEARKHDFLVKQERARALVRGGRDDEEIRPKTEAGEFYRADVDEIDFEFNDEFQDDDEGMIFGEEAEDAKEIEKRLREEMRGANLPSTGLKNDEKDWDEEEQKEKQEAAKERKLQKRLRKQLIKKERKYEYDSSSEHPYSESSDTEDSEEERGRLEEERKTEEARKAGQPTGDDKSGASTHGTNTPTGRAEKRDRARLNAATGGSLKRPGSPSLSEVSGTESRKKAKGINGRAISPAGATKGGRALSRECRSFTRDHLLVLTITTAEAAKSHVSRSTIGGYGSGSETDTSRTGRPKIRLKASPPGSPHEGSPAGSPRASRPGSRAQSPARSGTPPVRMPTEEEIRAAIPPGGIPSGELTKMFKPRVGKNQTQQFIALVMKVGKKDNATSLIVLR